MREVSGLLADHVPECQGVHESFAHTGVGDRGLGRRDRSGRRRLGTCHTGSVSEWA